MPAKKTISPVVKDRIRRMKWWHEAKFGMFLHWGMSSVLGRNEWVMDDEGLSWQEYEANAKKFTLTPAGHLEKGVPRHPIVEDDVVIYSGASVLGRITIGRGAIIGGNVWVTNDVPPGGVVTQAEVRQTRFSHGGGI